MQNFINELSNYLENNITNDNKIYNGDWSFKDIQHNNLILYGEKITARYKDKILTERLEILKKYGENTKEKGEMYYIYDVNSEDSNSFNLCICKEEESHKVITKSKDELPEGSTLGSVLRKNDIDFTLDYEGTKSIGKEINTMIRNKIKKQCQYLESKRVDGHSYEVGEKYSGRIWLYDLNNVQGGGMEGFEEIEFPEDLYQDAKEGDLFIYQKGRYEKN